MEASSRPSALEVLAVIAPPGQADKAAVLLRQEGAPVLYQCVAEGTATSEILNALGLGSTEKNVVLAIVPEAFARGMLHALRRELRLYMPGSGIAFLMPLTGMNSYALRMFSSLKDAPSTGKEREFMTGRECNYAIIAVVVNQGFTEDVMRAAKSAGARGGTVIHSRRVSDVETIQLWGLSLQEEKEIVLILATLETKVAMMSAISRSCGSQSPAKGIVLSMPIDAVAGLDDMEA